MRNDKNTDILIAGDTYFGEWHMRLRGRKGLPNILAERSYRSMGEAFEPLFQSADLVCVNLECAITEIEESPFKKEKKHTYAASPKPTLDALKALNTTIVTLANNHAVDYGKAGLVDTLEWLEHNDIAHIGAGRTLAEAQKPFVFEVMAGGQKRRIALLTALQVSNGCRKWGFVADNQHPGVLDIQDPGFVNQLEALRAASIFPIVIPHWGPNYSWRTDSMQKMAKDLAKAGAGLVVGHSGHMLQEMEIVKGIPIVFGVGNFILNGDGEYEARNLPPYSGVVRLTIDPEHGDVMLLRVYPFNSSNLATDFSPHLVTKSEFEHVIAFMRAHNYDPSRFDAQISAIQDEFGYSLSMEVPLK